MTSFRRKRLGEILAAKGVVTAARINEALAKNDSRQRRIGEVLLAEGLVTEELVAQSLAEQRDLRYIDLADHRINTVFFESITMDLMQRYQFIPLEDSGDVLVIALADPTNIPVIDELELLLQRQIEVVVSTPSGIQETLQRSGSSERVLQSVSEDFKFSIVKEQEDGGEEVLSLESIEKDESPIIKLIHTTVFDAIQRRASDIHIEATDKHVLIKYRIDGVLYPATEPINIQFHSAMVSRIKVMSDLDIAERRVPQDGRFKIRTGSKTIDFRVSIMPSAFGEDIVIRILDKESITAGVNSLRLESLGHDEYDLKRFRKSIREPYGMVLVTGPTGSGKTTTLYAMLSRLDAATSNITTVEDPIEYDLEGIGQTQVNPRIDMTFARALRAILRQDPDIIMIGEIRDLETAQIAVQASLTGHLVLATLHTNDSASAVTRLLDMGIESFLLSSSILGILAQRLLRKLCPECRRQDADGRWHAVGCPSCGQVGYVGRTGIYELLEIDERLRAAIHARESEQRLRELARAGSFRTLYEDGARWVETGVTSDEELLRVAREH